MIPPRFFAAFLWWVDNRFCACNICSAHPFDAVYDVAMEMAAS